MLVLKTQFTTRKGKFLSTNSDRNLKAIAEGHNCKVIIKITRAQGLRMSASMAGLPCVGQSPNSACAHACMCAPSDYIYTPAATRESI